jgi:DnaK suppressor protein
MKTRSPKRTTRRTAVTGNRSRKPAAGGKYGAIRRELEKQRQAILDEAGEGLTLRDKPEAFPDVSDQASAEVDQNFSMRIKEREQKLLKKIDEALDRLTKNTYGICERCEEEIPYQRLKARPVTTLCIACKTLQEQEEKIRR